MTYRHVGNRDLYLIAQGLGVEHVVEGTVRRDGNRVRITTRLIDARKDQAIWSDSFDRDVSDIFAIQSEIAQRVAAKLSARLSPQERKEIEEAPTNDLEAYDLYLQGKNLVFRAGVLLIGQKCGELLKAVRLLEEATRKDSRFALAYALLANAQDYLYYFDVKTPARRALGDAAVSEALRLRSDLPQVRLAAARHFYICYRDYKRARAEIAVAVRKLPNNSDAIGLTARLDRRQARGSKES